MREWTDVDYAQAAIDMLPGTVEEIVEFLRAQGVKSKWVGSDCPITRWANKWTEYGAGAGWETLRVLHPPKRIKLPLPVREYIQWVDSA